MAEIEARDLKLRYPVFGGRRGPDYVQALDGVSLDVRHGDRLAVIGRNGAGKSTLLRVLSGIVKPDAGEVRVSGAVQSLMNMGLGVQPDATGWENIRLRLLAAGRTWKEAREEAVPIADYSELGDRLDLPVETYSAGMQLRLSFSIVTALGAEVLIMDEWMGAGDAVFREKAAQRMHELVEAAGVVVLASHNNNLLRRVCNRGLHLRAGKVACAGDVEEALASYAEEIAEEGGAPVPQAAAPAAGPAPAQPSRKAASKLSRSGSVK